MDELIERSIKGSTFNRGEVTGALNLIVEEMARIMAGGRSVRIEGMGLFTPSLSLKKGKEREELDGKSPRRNATSIEIGGINFRPDRELIKNTNLECVLERGGAVQKCRKSKYSEEDRLKLLDNYLENHPFITVGEYASITGLSRTTAARELRTWADTPDTGVAVKGSGSHKVYVRKV